LAEKIDVEVAAEAVLADTRDSAAPQSPHLVVSRVCDISFPVFFLGLIALSVFDEPKFGHISPFF